MTRVSYFCSLARLDRKAAAQAFLAEASEEEATAILGASIWQDTDVQDFTDRNLAVLIKGKWGQFWLAATQVPKAKLQPPAPIVNPDALVSLARGIVDVIQN